MSKNYVEEYSQIKRQIQGNGFSEKINVNLKERMYYVKAILDQEVGHRGTIYVNGNLNEGFTPYFSEG